MTTPTVKREISLGTILHLVATLVTLGVMYGDFTTKFDESARQVREMQWQTERIEHYLSSEDRGYWQKVAQNGDRSAR